MLATLGRTAYGRRRPILCAWLLLVLAGFTIGAGVFNDLKDSNGVSSAESVHGAMVLHDGSQEGPGILVVVTDTPMQYPAVRTAAQTLVGRIERQPFVHEVTTADPAPHAGLVPVPYWCRSRRS